MNAHSAEKDGGRLAALLWSLDWPGKPEQGQQIWEMLDAELLPKRLYLSKAERLIESGFGFVADARKYAAKCAAETVRILDREVDVRAEVWDEGYDAHGKDIANEGLTEITLTPNPYRGGSDA